MAPCLQAAVDCFGEKSFDIVFSSNLLEHLPDPSVVLRGVHRLLKDDGITVHIMPGPFWKLCQMALYHPANGLASEYVYSAVKKGRVSAAAGYFMPYYHN